MLSVLLAWLVESGAGLLLGAIAGVVKDLVIDARNRKSIEELARAETQRDQYRDLATTKEAELKAAVDAPKNVPDAVKALREGKEG